MAEKILGSTIPPEDRATVLKEYFSRYLTDVRGLSMSSVKHYIDALNNISRRLVEKGLVQIDIYEIMDLEKLSGIQDILFSDPEFVELNTRGNHMYSAGLNNYFRFAEGTDFNHVSHASKMDVPIKAKTSVKTEIKLYNRSDILRTHTLAFANFHCELNNNHESFIAEKTKKPYMEVHHIIPVKWQAQFEYSLDVYANLISLCPVCHRQIHHGLKFDRLKLTHQIFDEREERLVKSGIILSRDEFTELVMR